MNQEVMSHEVMSQDWITAFIGLRVVVDTDADYLAIGTLVSVGPDHLELTGVDLHDHREANSTKDVYLWESRQIGIRANRERVVLARRRVVAVSRLDHVLG